jgi:hypothetical protein
MCTSGSAWRGSGSAEIRRQPEAGAGRWRLTACLPTTGIAAYPKSDGTLEKAAWMVNHASMPTTRHYDRRRDEMGLDEVERIRV